MTAEMLTPAEIDVKAAEYHSLEQALARAKAAAAKAQEPLDKLKDELIEIVSKFGSAHAEKSRLMRGINEEMIVTFGQSVRVDAAAVEKFRLALAERDQSRLASKMFEKTIRFSLKPGHDAIVRGGRNSRSRFWLSIPSAK